MKITKKILAHLTKCYSIAPLTYRGKQHFLVAAEKVDRCILFDTDGNPVDTVWSEPGGVMTMVQVPESDGAFLATHRFYSPNDSAQAKIVMAEPNPGGWAVRTLADLPFVHRFDILQANGRRYLIACTLKSAHAFRDDWSSPGKVYAAELPGDLAPYGESRQLPLTVIADGLTKNHGCYRIVRDGRDSCLISAQNGVFRFFPPENAGASWRIEQLLDMPASDAVLVDLDGDGEDELAVIEPFHGDTVRFYHAGNSGWRAVYAYEQAEFAHAIFGGTLLNTPAVLIGHRKGARDLLLLQYDKSAGAYTRTVLDHDVGPANVYCFRKNGADIIVSANREIDEVAMYTLTD